MKYPSPIEMSGKQIAAALLIHSRNVSSCHLPIVIVFGVFHTRIDLDDSDPENEQVKHMMMSVNSEKSEEAEIMRAPDELLSAVRKPAGRVLHNSCYMPDGCPIVWPADLNETLKNWLPKDTCLFIIRHFSLNNKVPISRWRLIYGTGHQTCIQS